MQPTHFDPYDFIGEGDSNTYIPLFSFGLRGMEDSKFPTPLGRLFDDESKKPQGGNVLTGEGIAVNPFMRAYQEDFAARAEWCFKEYKDANHAPIVTLKEMDIHAKPGEVIELNASVTDPDGDDYAVIWEHYNNFSNYSGKEVIRVWEPWKECTSLTIPSDAKAGDYIILTLRAQDKAVKPMTSYGQVIVYVD